MGRPFRLQNVVDEYTRESLAIDVARQRHSENVLERLGWLFLHRGIPSYIRSDNGPEFTAATGCDQLSRLDVGPLFIEPGSPWENGYVESFNGKRRDELLDGGDLLDNSRARMDKIQRVYKTGTEYQIIGPGEKSVACVSSANSRSTEKRF